MNAANLRISLFVPSSPLVTRWRHEMQITCRPGAAGWCPPWRPNPCFMSAATSRGPSSPAPDYSAIDANPFNKLFTTLFARRLADELGAPPPPASEGYAAVMRLVAGLNDRANGDPTALTAAAVRVLDSIFPRWLPPAFAIMFSKPMPRVALWLNAVVTLAVTQWLMGPSKLSNDGTMTVEIERCRYLEESGCIGICIGSCKLATESFFKDSMKLPLWIEPKFEDFSCR